MSITLSKTQTDILNKLKSGLYIWTNEGKGYKAWLGDVNGNFIESIDKRSAESLARNELIKPSNIVKNTLIFPWEIA